MQRRRARTRRLSILRWLLSCVISMIALGFLLAVHLSPFSTVPSVSDVRKLPKQRDIGYRGWSTELSWTQESAPPQLSRLLTSSQKLDSMSDGFEKLWEPPSNRGFVPCVVPSSPYPPPEESRGYLLVSTNGGLNQMRAGVMSLILYVNQYLHDLVNCNHSCNIQVTQIHGGPLIILLPKDNEVTEIHRQDHLLVPNGQTFCNFKLFSTTFNSMPYCVISCSMSAGISAAYAHICDMVAVACLINATLVIPKLDRKSFWQDSSKFSDVFNEEYFIQSLANDVKIVKKLPKELAKATKAVKYFTSWSGVGYYQDEISRLWDDYQVIQAAKSDSRLANNNLPPGIQKLRCRSCYEALRFAPRIEALGKLLVERMRSYGPYIALHLRYEKDMLAFSGCTYGLSPGEADELTIIRENTTYWKVKDIDPQEQRARGYCPLTPKEVGIFLSSLGYPSNTPIYIASGEIYGGDSHMADLKFRFPMLMSKEKLVSVNELEPFSHYASQMAALDYIVSVESDVFIPSYSGNMARAVEGHRRYLGHRKTVIPDRKALVRLFDKIDQGSLKEGKRLSDMIVQLHKKRQGSPRKRKGPISGTRGKERFRSEEAFYENPLPDCLCQWGSHDRNSSLANI